MHARMLALVIAALALCGGTAVAAGYGTGTFHGTVTSSLGKPRPHTKVTVKVRPGKARIARLGVVWHCTGEDGLPERFTTRVSSAFEKVSRGAAGGGLRVVMHPEVTRGGVTYRTEVEVFAGLRATTVTGTADGTLFGADGSVLCSDYARFTARR